MSLTAADKCLLTTINEKLDLLLAQLPLIAEPVQPVDGVQRHNLRQAATDDLAAALARKGQRRQGRISQ